MMEIFEERIQIEAERSLRERYGGVPSRFTIERLEEELSWFKASGLLKSLYVTKTYIDRMRQAGDLYIAKKLDEQFLFAFFARNDDR